MKKLLCTLSFGLFTLSAAQDWKTDDQYIQNFAKYAVEEMELYKIPASIKLAQGLLETGGGQSRLAKEGKNHFGIKCKEDWTGKTMRHTDDAPNECFRVYEDPRQSYRDHSIFLSTRKYYTGLFKLDMKDYKAWAHGLKKAGYATNPKYAYILIDRIEKYKLHEFDHLKPHEVENKLMLLYPGYKAKEEIATKAVSEPREEKVEVKSEEKTPPAVKAMTKQDVLNALSIKSHPNGGTKYVILGGDLDLGSVAQKYAVEEKKLMKYNDLETNLLKKNQIVFLENKRLDGSQEFYKAQKGEKMYDISQKLGIKLNRLYTKNRMKKGEEPKEGQLIYLQSRKPM